MSNEHEELEEIFGSEDVTLRMALAEAEMEISLLKIELMRTKQKLEQAETALRAQAVSEDYEEPLTASGFAPRTERKSVPPSIAPQETICTKSGFRSLAPAGSLEAALRSATER